MNNMFTVSSSPHIRHVDTTSGIMADVIIALCPTALFGCIIFGWRALLTLAVTVLSAVLAEFLWCLCLKKENSIGDLSAVVTGLLLGLNLPPEIPVWIAAIGSVVAIIIVKQMFGGLGCNFANPAIVARIVLMVSFPTHMTRFIEPFAHTVSSATPLADDSYNLKELFFGQHGGSIGETASYLLIIGGIYLLMRRVISPVIPLSFIGTVAIATLISGDDPLKAILSGGVMIGAIFMATDYVTSPTTPLGQLIFGIGCGLLTFVIRRFAALPEGVSYAILLMNILTPHINTFTLSKPFGAPSEKKKKEAEPNG